MVVVLRDPGEALVRADSATLCRVRGHAGSVRGSALAEFDYADRRHGGDGESI